MIAKIAAILIAIGILAFLTLEATVYAGRHTEIRGEPQVVLILGCKIWGEEPSPALQSRLDTALKQMNALEEKGVRPVIVVSGGKGDDEPISEAQSMADYLIGQGIDPERIYREDQSTCTAENLKNTLALLEREQIQWQHMAIVSNDFHLTRVRMLAKRYGIDCSTWCAPSPTLGSDIASSLREAPAIIKSYFMDGTT